MYATYTGLGSLFCWKKCIILMFLINAIPTERTQPIIEMRQCIYKKKTQKTGWDVTVNVFKRKWLTPWIMVHDEPFSLNLAISILDVSSDLIKSDRKVKVWKPNWQELRGNKPKISQPQIYIQIM